MSSNALPELFFQPSDNPSPASLLVISYICGGGGQTFVVKNFGYRKQNVLIL